MSSAEENNGMLDEFAAELHQAVDSEFATATVTETQCWLGPLRDVRRALEDLAPSGSAGESAHALRGLLVPNDLWPLPKLLGGALLNLDALMSLAMDELQGREGAPPESVLAAFRKAYQSGAWECLKSTYVASTVDLTQLARSVQSWQMTLSLTSASNPDKAGVEAQGGECETEHAALVVTLDELSRTSMVKDLGTALHQVIDDALAHAKEEFASVDENFRARVRRRWGQTQAGAVAYLRQRREQDLYARSARWARHHEGLWGRVELQRSLLALDATLQESVHEGVTALEHEVVAPVREHLGQAIAALRSAQQDAKSWLEGPQATDWGAGALEVRKHHQRTTSAVANALTALDGLPLVETAGALSDGCVGSCHEALGELPERLHTVELDETDPAEWPLELDATLTPREWAARAFDVGRMSAARAALLQLADAVREGVEQAHKAPEVLDYNLEAALDEMQVAAGSGDTKEDPWVLVATGLDRTADFLDRIVESVGRAHLGGSRAAKEEIDGATIDLLARLTQEDAWAAEFGDLWSNALDQASEVGRTVRSTGSRTVSVAAQVAEGAFGRARTALERARRMIAGGASPAASDQTLRELSAVDVHASALPFVYRRLFSPRPVVDPTLFVGREEHVEAVLSHWSDWKSGRTDTLVVTAPYGGGMRSLMTAVAAASQDPSVWRRASLDTRVESEAELARILASAVFGAEHPGTIETLEGLADALEHLDGPCAVHVERMEHTFERTVNGFRLIEAALEFFSRTDSLVGWFVTMSADAWTVLTTVSPSAAALARHHEVGPLDEAGLANMLMTRHQRSGLALQFDEQSVPKASRDPKDANAAQAAFFSRFWELTDGSAPLALLYWIRSAHYEPDSEHVTLRWPESLDFDFLQELSWDQAFALQAFLEHGTLRVSDYARIFSTSADRSYEVLESLGNLYLIEPAGAIRRVGEQLTFTTVARADPYRVRPVLQPMVRRLLKARHLSN